MSCIFLVKKSLSESYACLMLSSLFLAKIHLIDIVLSSFNDVASHFDEINVLSLGKLFHLTGYLSVNGNMGCPVIKRDRIHCAFEECAMLFCGNSLNKVLAVRMRTADASLRFPCAKIFLHANLLKVNIHKLIKSKYIHYSYDKAVILLKKLIQKYVPPQQECP